MSINSSEYKIWSSGFVEAAPLLASQDGEYASITIRTIDGERAIQQFPVAVLFTCIIDGERRPETATRTSPFAYSEPVTLEVVQAEAKNWWEEIKVRYNQPEDVQIKICDEFYETWVVGWFSHWTFRLGRSDQELLRSFDKYVSRIERHNARVRFTGEGREFSLMGAEDRWRWKGNGREGTPAPCGCEHCITQGITRIDH